MIYWYKEISPETNSLSSSNETDISDVTIGQVEVRRLKWTEVADLLSVRDQRYVAEETPGLLHQLHRGKASLS